MSFFIQMASTFSQVSGLSQVKLSTCCNTKAKAHAMVLTRNLGQGRTTEKKECGRILSITLSVLACFSFLLVAYFLRLSYLRDHPINGFSLQVH